MPEAGWMPEASWAWLPAADRVPTPWRNGGGTTTEVFVRGAGVGRSAGPGAGDAGFAWRVSIAVVEHDGDFSLYPGVDRWLMPLSAGGLRLIDDGTLVPVGRHEVRAFPGERAVASVGVTTPTLDLNLMLRRSRSTGSLATAEVAGSTVLATAAAEELVAVVLEGVFAAAPGAVPEGFPEGAQSGRSLARHDAVFLGAGRQGTLHGVGRIAVARIATAVVAVA